MPTNVDIPIGVGVDKESDSYTVGPNQNTDVKNISIRTPGVEKKRRAMRINADSLKFEGDGVNNKIITNLFYWVEDNLLNTRAWIYYDKSSGLVTIKEG